METTTANPILLLQCYKDVVGRIIRGLRNKATNQYTIESRLYNSMGQAVSFMSYTFPDRASYKRALKRFPREKREKLAKIN